MADQTILGLSTMKSQGTNFSFSKKEKEILRSLAGKVGMLAARTIEAQKRKLWYDHNALKNTRPVIFCDPENGWNEIIPEDVLECSNDLARAWEMILRKEIFWAEKMGDDRVTDLFFNIPYTYDETDWGMHEVKIGGHNGGSYTWEAPLKDYDIDLPRLKFPEIQVDYEMTNKSVDLANEIFGDLLNVRVKGVWWWTLGMTWTLITLRGLENYMTDFYLYPDQLKKLMELLRDGHLAKLDFLEKNGLLSLNNDGTYVGSGGFGYSDELPQKDFDGKNVRTMDMWGFSESQETTSVSPDLFEEFVFQYQLPIIERFGLNCYGCCEPLNMRWHIIKNIPRLRRVSVSPWADVKAMADFLENKYIYSRKPSPADVSISNPDWNKIRKELRDFIKTTKNCRVEIIMKENHTIANNPENVINWCRIAKEEAENI